MKSPSTAGAPPGGARVGLMMIQSWRTDNTEPPRPAFAVDHASVAAPLAIAVPGGGGGGGGG
eukprot:CAMPEP_0202338628 /NCGR_PEP_ID=MMETSP1126-20121109/828_1 /ASSEMBLY_ACC=CAM_ASM_000457 /TAXON_ID=3047 /ORGANISM="Dunaliella tertiolecta, Strain CCMP1320" /LENGTH=61 /DNA_ID=CAMNT_0048929045 /DNA_START=1108 /DNA_END=1290 /DNA_ORIENTATION=-